jgi:predicted DNA-binding transcriptional regulator YafY
MIEVYERMQKIDDAITKHLRSDGPLNATTLGKLLHVDVQTIYRDIDCMNKEFGMGIKYDKGQKSYIKTGRAAPSRWALRKARTEQAKTTNEAADADVNNDTSLEDAALYARRFVFDNAALQSIIVGIRENCRIAFDYHSLERPGNPEKVTVRPYQLIQKGNMWHLWAYVEEIKSPKLFKTGFIMNSQILEGDYFELPAEFEYEE